MADQIQPSSDARATAIAVAWSIANIVSWKDTDEAHAKKAAKLVGELAQEILALTNDYAISQRPEKTKA